MKIIPASPKHLPAVWQLIRDLAIYEKAENEFEVSEEQLHDDVFGEQAIAHVLVAELNAQVVGFALYYIKYSTWKGKSLYLEDFLVQEHHRKKGIGAAIFRAVMEEAKLMNAGRMEWQVLDWNEPAIAFYKKMGADLDGEWLNGKFTREQLQELV